MSIGLKTSALNAYSKFTGTKMQLVQILKALERDLQVTLRFNATDLEALDRAIARFHAFAESHNYIVNNARFVKAAIEYTVKDINWQQQRMEVELPLTEGKHWLTTWREYIKDNVPEGYTLRNSSACRYEGCPKLIAVWIEYTVSRN